MTQTATAQTPSPSGHRPAFLNFQVDHMTLLLDPKMYNVSYAIFRTLFGAGQEDILYEKRKEWAKGKGETSMTFAVRIGADQASAQQAAALRQTIVAVVQPSEPESQPSHVRDMLEGHSASAHWQHIALRTSDLLAFHQYALQRGINFITPILKDADEDLIQTFSGEWFFPGAGPSGLFFEFVQRNPNPNLLKKLEERNKETWFRDRTFLGLYAEKEKEYRSGTVTPFLDPRLFEKLQSRLASKKLWEIGEEDLRWAEGEMQEYARRKKQPSTQEG
ncbi:MAG: hypothetical protein HY402_00455 [Elusimicrobia bacterium]|nr:hypothetical protein [Elusimicrobiota bacterium]